MAFISAGASVAITGGARGIGMATARACVRAGMKVTIGDIDPAACSRAADEIGCGAVASALDVRDATSFASFLDAAEQAHGPLEVLVNNAGVAPVGLFVDEDPADTRRALDINLGGVLTGTQLALQRFLPRGRGHIVNLASSAGQIATAGGATYAATKHGVVGLTRAVRAEIRGTGVRTTIVMPGLIRTDMIDGLAPGRGVRIVGPEQVADAIVAALRTGRAEIFVPREMGPVARLIAGTPPAVADRIKRLLAADAIMTRTDISARSAYRARLAETVRELNR